MNKCDNKAHVTIKSSVIGTGSYLPERKETVEDFMIMGAPEEMIDKWGAFEQRVIKTDAKLICRARFPNGHYIMVHIKWPVWETGPTRFLLYLGGNMKIFKMVLIMALLFYSGISLAEELPEKFPEEFPGGEEGFYEGTEDDVIITATRYIKRIEEAPATATVITAEQIRNMGARDILDVLKMVPGIGISRITGYGFFGIESRGIKNNHSQKVLIMIDGHRINEPNSGGASFVFNNMMVENIKRVEVIRGPGSALYGANAFVAVINVVTKNA
ncbi:MAG: Plug domain-containing protein, partial [Planctomycetes bacterium]|nr:Plug domain-containing protein [Planctomycetota bacterium]